MLKYTIYHLFPSPLIQTPSFSICNASGAVVWWVARCPQHHPPSDRLFLSSFSNGSSGCFGGWTFCGCLNPHFQCRVSKRCRCFASSSSVRLGLKTRYVLQRSGDFVIKRVLCVHVVLLKRLVVMVAVAGWSRHRHLVLFKSHTVTPGCCLFMIQRVSEKSSFDMGHLSFDPDLCLKITVGSAAVVRSCYGSEFVLARRCWVLNPSTLKWDSNCYARKVYGIALWAIQVDSWP